ncbi:MAG: CRISPR-associated ring nuclease [Anaerolineae bacterium]
MSQNILIAALGDHPAVVTGMVKALREFEGIEIDTLHVLHPQNTGKYIGREGFRLIQGHLAAQCDVQPVPLPFPDANTSDASLVFLQNLAELLGAYRDETTFRVFLSLAGGRKNTSALMGLVAQFFPAVQGLYHLLDRREGRHDACFYSIEEMELELSEEQVEAALDPPLDQLNLVSIPYPGAFANVGDLWRGLQTGEALAYSPEVAAFYSPVLNRRQPDHRLRVWVSEQAIRDYHALGAQMQNKLIGYARRMQYPAHLEAKASGPRGWKTDCEVYPEHKAHSNLRLFYHWDRQNQTVTICRAMLHQEYDRQGCVWFRDHTNLKPLSALKQDYILVVPLGKSPMIATQTYTLLQESEEGGRPRIPTVTIVYPEQSPPVNNGVRLLKRQFELRQVEFIPYPIRGFKDVDSTEACNAYLGTLLTAIEDLRKKYPDRQIALSLSGGRKGMSVLALFAAQWAGIERLYHTLITDLELEKQVEQETSLDALKKLPTDGAKAKRLFLAEYGVEHFQLFTIPVIPFQSSPIEYDNKKYSLCSAAAPN